MNEKKIDQKFAVIAYAAALVVSTVASALVSATVKPDTNLYLYLCYLLPQAGYISVFLIMCKKRKIPFTSLLAKENVNGMHYLYAGILAVGLLFFAILPNNYIRLLFEKLGSSASTVVPRFDTPWDYVLCGIIICVLPAIGEELIFRKAFCDGMESVADYKTVLLCGLAFSLSHLNLAQTVHQFVLGCCLGYVYVKTKNITLTMFMHFINNFIALYLESITGKEIWNNITVPLIACIVGAVFVAVGILLFYKKSKKLDNTKKGGIEMIMQMFLIVLGVAWAICAVLSFIN